MTLAVTLTTGDLITAAQLVVGFVLAATVYKGRRIEETLKVTKSTLDLTTVANGELRKEIEDVKRRAVDDQRRCDERLATNEAKLAVLESSFAERIAEAVVIAFDKRRESANPVVTVTTTIPGGTS